ncbi:MAG: ATP-grasp domain-containing protein [Candidatus Altiarchaeota archaeon]|nr:ATP-grasp domain-containing protein [Candidatus Altiarchaeota archaeon]
MISVLVVGLNCRPVATAAKKAGLRVGLVDFFGDIDLKGNVDTIYQVDEGGNPITSIKNYSPELLVEKAKMAVEDFHPDGLLLTSEIGCNPKYVRMLEGLCPIFGNGYEEVSRVRDWTELFGRLDEMHIPHPSNYVIRSKRELERITSNLDFPMVTKPIKGSSGCGVKLVEGLDGVLAQLREYGEILLQEYVQGINASVSVISSNKGSRAVSLNEQLLGLSELNCAQFKYCGNIVPLENSLRAEAFSISERICNEFGLRGSNGIDFVLAEKPYVIEVNPRFQDTQDCIQRAYGVNLVNMHLDAIEGRGIEAVNTSGGYWCKGILFSGRDCTVGDLKKVGDIADIPKEGSRIPAQNPVCSVFSSGLSRDKGFYGMIDKVQRIKALLR